MAALVLSFLIVTAGVGTVAAAASEPRAVPRALPSDGRAGAADLTGPNPVPATGHTAPAGVRPGLPEHVSPGPPVAFQFSPPPITTVPQHGMAAGILVDLDSRQVLWSENPQQRRPTASLAKVFTVMVALDHASSLAQPVRVPPGGEDDSLDHTVVGLHVGDIVSVGQLIDGVWLASGDDAAETLARALVPRDEFIAEMNAKAAWLGLTDTHFTNPSGLDDGGEYSTAYDLAVASAWVWLHYPQAFSLAGQKYVPLWLRGQDYGLRTLNKMVDQFPGTTEPYPGANGLKTGDTPNAGGCVIATAQRGNRRLIAVVMGDDWFFTDAGAVLDRGFAVDP